jgi:hypothetical protein
MSEHRQSGVLNDLGPITAPGDGAIFMLNLGQRSQRQRYGQPIGLGVDLFRAKLSPEFRIRVSETIHVLLVVRNLRIMLDGEDIPHPIRHGDPAHRGEAEVRRKVLFERIAKELPVLVSIRLVPRDEHCGPGCGTEHTRVHVREGHPADPGIVDE